MFIDRENRIKLLKNVGQYIIDNAEAIIPQDGPLRRQMITIDMAVEYETPQIRVSNEYVVREALRGIRFGKN